jgi:hypothetical protein
MTFAASQAMTRFFDGQQDAATGIMPHPFPGPALVAKSLREVS